MYNEPIQQDLEEKLKKCRETYDFIALGFYPSCHISELDSAYHEEARIDIWSDGYYLIKVADNGNSHFMYAGQHQEQKD